MDLQKILCLCEEMNCHVKPEWQERGDLLLNEIRKEILDTPRESLHDLIEKAKNSEYGAVWYSERGPIQITKEGELVPLKEPTFGKVVWCDKKLDKSQARQKKNNEIRKE